MQINNGHLVADMTSLPEHMADRYTAIPPRLRAEAARVLGGRRSARVDLAQRSRLAKWAAGRRRAKRKAARMARRKNRH